MKVHFCYRTLDNYEVTIQSAVFVVPVSTWTNQPSIHNILTCIIGVRRWHGIWQIRWSPTGYWRRLQLMRCVMWRAGWLLTNRGQLIWTDDWIIQWRRNRYQWWWQLFTLWVTVLEIGSPVITSSRSLPTLIVPCSTVVAITNTLWTLHDKCNMSLWCCCVPVILFVDGHQNMRAKFLAKQCSCVWVSVLVIKLVTSFLSQYHPN